ncbi:HEAT repeat domain-containing protein [Candidatus Poribacteria bacterium]|nr:HEAT repeat domain-containing protein [Candidatus Poribacteria bacterium]
MMETLKERYRDWEKWAATADTSEDGWQSYYPAWGDLMYAAISAMTQQSPSLEDIEYIEKCWAISEETEDLGDYAKDHIEPCWGILRHLVKSVYPEVRWQVYSVLGFAGPKAESLLRRGLQDSDNYCKRRAILSLARLQPKDARLIADPLVRDTDPYIRQASIEIARVSKDPELMNRIKELLLRDAVAYVREAARTLENT